METYEIRILRFDGQPSLIAEQKYLSAEAAITAAKLLAAGRRFEVWNDDYCVYVSAAKDSSPRPPPGQNRSSILPNRYDGRPC